MPTITSATPLATKPTTRGPRRSTDAVPGMSILLRNERRTPITMKAMPVMPIPRPDEPEHDRPAGDRSTPRLASSAACSASTRAPRATDAAIRPSAMKIAAWPHAPMRAPHFFANPCVSSDGARRRMPSRSCQMPSAHRVIAISHSTTKPSGAPAIAMSAPDWSVSPSPPNATTSAITPIRMCTSRSRHTRRERVPERSALLRLLGHAFRCRGVHRVSLRAGSSGRALLGLPA